MSSLHSSWNGSLEREPALTDGFERPEPLFDRGAAPALRLLAGDFFVGGEGDLFFGTAHETMLRQRTQRVNDAALPGPHDDARLRVHLDVGADQHGHVVRYVTDRRVADHRYAQASQTLLEHLFGRDALGSRFTL